MTGIRILGAGPAGLTAAICLARRGHRVTVFEKHRHVGGRFHGDFQGLENWSREEDVLSTLSRLGIRPDFALRPIHGGSFYNPDLRRLEVRSGDPLFYLVRRGPHPGSLDRSMQRQAEEAGVEIRFRERRNPETADIVATGPRTARVVASGIQFETDSGDRAGGILNDELAPKGYAYLLISGGMATLATVLYDRFPEAKACLARAIETFQGLSEFQIRNPREFGGYGDFGVPASAVRSGRRYAGEAAGFQDFLFGFGIRYAILSGALAAQSLDTGEDYDTLWNRKVGAQLRGSWRNRLLYERLGRIGCNLLIRGTSLHPRGFMRRLYGGWPLADLAHLAVTRLRPLSRLPDRM
jgi:flavin-dependent dehydrogenase